MEQGFSISTPQNQLLFRGMSASDVSQMHSAGGMHGEERLQGGRSMVIVDASCSDSLAPGEMSVPIPLQNGEETYLILGDREARSRTWSPGLHHVLMKSHRFALQMHPAAQGLSSQAFLLHTPVAQPALRNCSGISAERAHHPQTTCRTSVPAAPVSRQL